MAKRRAKGPSSTKKQNAKKASSKLPAKKASSKKKAAPKKAAAKKAPAKKAPLKKAPVKKAPAKAPVKKAPAKKAPVKKAPAKETPAKKAPAKKAPALPKKAPAAPQVEATTVSRVARSTLAQKRAIQGTLGPAPVGKDVVDAYMRDVDHPFKAEMEAVRQIILAAGPQLAERIKWNAPSFYFNDDFAAFNPRSAEFVHLIVLFPGGAGMDDHGDLLEGKHKDRREAKFHSMADVQAKKAALERLVRSWLELRPG